MSIVGAWDVTIDTPMGSQVVTLDFTDEHTGVARYGSDTVPLQDVRADGDAASCTVKISQPVSVTLKCNVTIDGDTLSGTASAGFFGKFALNGHRTDGGR